MLTKGVGNITALVQYFLQDEFITALSEGNVNGTAAEPKGTRVDVNNNTSIVSNSLVINSTTDILYFAEAITRAAGQLYIAHLTASADSDFDVVSVGFDDAKTAAPDRLAYQLAAATVLNVVVNGVTVAIGNYSGQTDIYLAIALRASGAFFWHKYGSGGTWTQDWNTETNSTTPLYAGAGGSGGAPAVNVDFHRVPLALFTPSPLSQSLFTAANGTALAAYTPDVGLGWWDAGGTWDIQSNRARNSPTGVELIADPGMDDSSKWTAGAGWTVFGGVATRVVTAGQTFLLNINTIAPVVGDWINITGTAAVTAGSFQFAAGGVLTAAITGSETVTLIGRAISTNKGALVGNNNSAGTVSDLSAIILTLSELITASKDPEAEGIVEHDVYVVAGTQYGHVRYLDSKETPANFLLAHHDGVNAHLVKCIAGVYTELINTAATYAAGAKIKTDCYISGTNVMVKLFYNGALIGTEQTVAGLYTNTLCGKFSTYDGNSGDNWAQYPRSSAAITAALNRVSA